MSIVNTLPFRNLAVVQSALGGTVSTTIFNADSPHCRVLDAWCVNNGTGGAADTVTVDDGTTAITDAMDMNVADKLLVRAGSIDDATALLQKGSTLRATHASASPTDTFILITILGE